MWWTASGAQRRWYFKALRVFVALALFIGFGSLAEAQVGIRFGVPGLSVGINIPVYPRLVEVPGYPVYYAPDGDSNLFFYDGLYWVYVDDRWYASEWYNGPWELVEPEAVPYFILRVPVQYYRRPPRVLSRLESPSAATLGRALGP